MREINVAMVVIIATVVLSQNWLAGLKAWIADKVFVPGEAATVMGQFIPGSSGSSSGGGSGGGGGSSSGGAVTLWNVPIVGPDGSVGTIQVDSSSAGGAFVNAGQGGNTPIGPPVPA